MVRLNKFKSAMVVAAVVVVDVDDDGDDDDHHRNNCRSTELTQQINSLRNVYLHMFMCVSQQMCVCVQTRLV